MNLEQRITDAVESCGASVEPRLSPVDSIVARAEREMRRRRAVAVGAVLAVAATATALVWTGSIRSDHADIRVVDQPSQSTADPQSPGSWRRLPTAPIEPRQGASTVWTGKEFIVWGGRVNSGYDLLDDGAAYDPATGNWRPITPGPWTAGDAPAVWASSDMAVWTGDDMVVAERTRVAAYNPTTDRWTDLPSLPDPEAGQQGVRQLLDVDGDVIAVSFDQESSTSVLDMWRLSDDRQDWVPLDSLPPDGPVGTLPVPSRVVATPDGVLAWSENHGTAWLHRPASGWERLEQITMPGNWTISGAHYLVVDNLITAVLTLQKSDGTSTVTTTYTGNGWTPVQPRNRMWFFAPRPVTIDGQVLIVGSPAYGGHEPLMIDPDTNTDIPLRGYPIDTFLDQAVAASDSALFVWSGQNNSPDGVQPTDAVPLSIDGAIWTLSAN